VSGLRRGEEDYPSPLRTFLTEVHEIFQELISIGFPMRTAEVIVAQLVVEGVSSRSEDVDIFSLDLDEEEEEEVVGEEGPPQEEIEEKKDDNDK